VRKISATAFTLLVLSAISSAQIPTGGNIFFGYSYSHGEAFAGTASGGASMNGWEGSAEGKYLPWIGVVADFDWHYGGRDLRGCVGTPCLPRTFRVNGSRHTVLFGPRASISVGKYTPFAELLVGIAHQTDAGGGISNSDTTFATAIGGGPFPKGGVCVSTVSIVGGYDADRIPADHVEITGGVADVTSWWRGGWPQAKGR